MKKVVRILGILILLAVAGTGCHEGKREKEDGKNSKKMSKMSRNDFRNKKEMGRKSGSFMMKGMKPGMGRMGNMGRNGQMRQPMRQGQMANMHRGMGQGTMGMRPGMANGMRRGMGMGMMKKDSIGMGQMGRGAGGGMGQMGRGNAGGMGQMGRGNAGGMGQMGSPAGGGMGQMNRMDNGPVGPGGIFLGNIPNVTEKQKKEFNDLLKKQQDEMTKMRADMAAKIKSTIESQRTKMLNIFTAEQKKAIGSR